MKVFGKRFCSARLWLLVHKKCKRKECHVDAQMRVVVCRDCKELYVLEVH